MTSQLITSANQLLTWVDTGSIHFEGIRFRGTKLLTAEESFGIIYVQPFLTPSFSIQLTTLHLKIPFQYKTALEGNGWVIQLLITGHETEYRTAQLSWVLQKNQFVIIEHSPNAEICANHKSPGISSCIQIHVTTALIEEQMGLFPEFQKAYTCKKETADPLLTLPASANAEILDLIHTILNCPYTEELRTYYVNSKIKDLLFQCLLIQNTDKKEENMLTSKEIRAVRQAENKITQDLSQHKRIPELAKEVLLNEYRFKFAFKKIFGMGPYEYLVRQRMKMAIGLLQTGKSVKEVAALTGYRPSDFTVAFMNHYGFTPSSIKKTP